MIETKTIHSLKRGDVDKICLHLRNGSYEMMDLTVEHEPSVMHVPDHYGGWKEFRASHFKTETVTLRFKEYEITIKKSS